MFNLSTPPPPRFIKTYKSLSWIGTLLLSLAILSCSKNAEFNDEPPETIAQSAKSSERNRFKPPMEEINGLIVDFLAKYKNQTGTARSGGDTIELEEAIWTIEAGLNYDYCDHYDEIALVTSDDVEYILDYHVNPHDSKLYIEESEMFEAYEYMDSIIIDLKTSVDIFVLADIEFKLEGSDVVLTGKLVHGIQPDLPDWDWEEGVPPFYGGWYHSDGLGTCGAGPFTLHAALLNDGINDAEKVIGHWLNSSKAAINATSTLTFPYCTNVVVAYTGIVDAGYFNQRMFSSPISNGFLAFCANECHSLSTLETSKDHKISALQNIMSAGSQFVTLVHFSDQFTSGNCPTPAPPAPREHAFFRTFYGVPTCTGRAL